MKLLDKNVQEDRHAIMRKKSDFDKNMVVKL